MDLLEKMQWKMNIKIWASELGFVSVGFTSAESMDSLAPLLKAQIDQCLATPFEIKEIKRRIDPRTVWQDCQSIVALAYPLPSTIPPLEGEGVIARSAVGEDYHRVIHQKINQLVDTMVNNNWLGRHRLQVDAGPLIERAFAVRAGIGWIGRNQQLIIPNYGSFVALALLLLDQTIPPDAALKVGQCGACQKCLQACPAQIIGQEPFAAKRCISYLTQSKEVLTAEERGQLGTQIFGCDVCQEVCPHNQKRMMEEKVFPSSLRRGVDLLETLNLTKGEFQQRFRATAAGWRGKGVLQRNAFLAMHNIKDDRRQQWLREREKDKSLPPIIIPYTRCD